MSPAKLIEELQHVREELERVRVERDDAVLELAALKHERLADELQDVTDADNSVGTPVHWVPGIGFVPDGPRRCAPTSYTEGATARSQMPSNENTPRRCTRER